jgi:hypothetical protein
MLHLDRIVSGADRPLGRQTGDWVARPAIGSPNRRFGRRPASIAGTPYAARVPRFLVAAPMRRRLVALAVVWTFATAASGCSAGASPAPSFDPTGPCSVDGRVAGAYPDLEARIPKVIAGKPPQSIDSGRNCTAANLTTLANHGLTEVHFAGAVWSDAAQSAITLSVWQAPGLQAAWMGEWFEAGARAANSTGGIQTSRPTINGRQAYRLDLVNSESQQVVITWPSPSGDLVQVLLAADEPEARIQQAIAAFP